MTAEYKYFKVQYKDKDVKVTEKIGTTIWISPVMIVKFIINIFRKKDEQAEKKV
jgi:hypothetical protein